MLVSIITPSFQQGNFIRASLESVLNQSYHELEYLVFDAGSTDTTLSILRDYEHDARFSWVSQSDAGQAAAINQGMRLAKGDIIAWLNADDLYLPHSLSTVVNFFQQNPEADFVYGDAIAIDEHGYEYGRRINVKACDFYSLLYEGDFIVQPSAFWRRSLLERIGFLNENLHYVLDYEYWIRAAQRVDLHYLPTLLSKERLHGRTKTAKGGIKRMEEMLAVIQEYGGQSIPRHFRPEASALYALRALNTLMAAQWTEASYDFIQAQHWHQSSVKELLYVLALLWGGDKALMQLRLYSNYLRSVWAELFSAKEASIQS